MSQEYFMREGEPCDNQNITDEIPYQYNTYGELNNLIIFLR